MIERLPLGTQRPPYADPLPPWVEGLREQQVDAVREIMDRYDSGVDVVQLEAPVGSGKTLIGDLTRRELQVPQAVYICSDKSLQDQVLRDFPYGRALKGRANYPTQHGRFPITCEDCTKMTVEDSCRWCSTVCPYRVAKARAIESKLAVLNTSMFLHMANYTEDFSANPFVIADECDLLEDALTGFIEYEVPQWAVKAMNLDLPKKGVHKTTLVTWLGEFETALKDHLHSERGNMEPKRLRAVENLRWETNTAGTMLERDIKRNEDADDEHGYWVRDYETDTFKLRPVLVSRYGPRTLWQHGKRWLLMSGTIVSPEVLADSLGIVMDYETVTVPHTFPVENRPVILAPIALMTYKHGETDWPNLVYAIRAICNEHEGRVLVHTVSYKLATHLMRKCGDLRAPNGEPRPKFTHQNSSGKAEALSGYLRAENSVLFSPSMNRGVDLAEDKCRVQIICKTPFASLKDKQVSARLHLPGGDLWYAVKAVRDIIQMTGRGVRSETDTCITYILDRTFVTNIWLKYSHLFLSTFKDSVNARSDIRWLINRGTR